jgi:hypothetical protein
MIMTQTSMQSDADATKWLAILWQSTDGVDIDFFKEIICYFDASVTMILLELVQISQRSPPDHRMTRFQS